MTLLVPSKDHPDGVEPLHHVFDITAISLADDPLYDFSLGTGGSSLAVRIRLNAASREQRPKEILNKLATGKMSDRNGYR